MIAPASPAATRAARTWAMAAWRQRYREARERRDAKALDDLDDELLAMGGSA